jgi:hypothetical protein
MPAPLMFTVCKEMLNGARIKAVLSIVASTLFLVEGGTLGGVRQQQYW